jgi:RecA-family ATPase
MLQQRASNLDAALKNALGDKSASEGKKSSLRKSLSDAQKHVGVALDEYAAQGSNVSLAKPAPKKSGRTLEQAAEIFRNRQKEFNHAAAGKGVAVKAPAKSKTPMADYAKALWRNAPAVATPKDVADKLAAEFGKGKHDYLSIAKNTIRGL